MFLENDYARPLFDFEKGGPPTAFKCLMTVKPYHNTTLDCTSETCKKVTRTERGMRMHLKIVHGWKEQSCLYSTDSGQTGNGDPRKLRAGPPKFPSAELSVEGNTEKILPSRKSQETNEGELLKLMKEER